MNLFGRVTRVALVSWALCLSIALTAFALHVEAPHEDGGGPTCALCIARNVTSAIAVVAPLFMAVPALCWRLQPWPRRVEIVFLASIKRADNSRDPPAEVFLHNQI